MGTLYQIGEVCHLTGLTPRALHYYDEIGVLVPSERLAGGYRLYTDSDIEHIRQIKSLKSLLGLSLSEIKRILDADEARARLLAAAQKASDPTGRTPTVERALQVTEEQLQSVQSKVRQLGLLQQQLECHVQELRALLHDAEQNQEPST
jgi:DNA-binding transcriptional MerR regulator